ncbi:MAG: AbrB/MazE/SpoVT family DNA-binding domain-containing protein [Nanoarchaeota archaeon]
MNRKLVKQGTATLMISLPSKWLKDHSLDKGDNIDLEQLEDNLVISPAKLGRKMETEITLRDLNESSIRTLITNTYRKGYDKITVNFDTQHQFQILEDVIRKKLIGFDITKKEAKKCFVENITEPSFDQFENILGKVFLNISSLFEITRARLNNDKTDEDFEIIEEKIMQYDNFCRRVISKGHLIKERKEFFWSFLHLVDHGQRELYHLNRAMTRPPKILNETLNDAEKMFELAKKSYLEKDLKSLSEMHALDKKAFYERGYKTLEKLKGKEVILGYHLMACLRKFFQTNSPLSGLLL